MQKIKNTETKKLSPSTAFFLPNQINSLIAYLNKENSADFLGFPAWLKQQALHQSRGQQYAEILKTIYTHWEDNCHQYKFPQLSLFIAHVTNQFSAVLSEQSFSGSSPLSVARQFFDALESLIDKGVFKADKDGGAKAQIELDRLLANLATVISHVSEEFTAKLSSGEGLEVKAKSFPLEDSVNAPRMVKLIMTIGIQSSQTINLPLIVNSIAALGTLSRLNLVSGYASIETLLQLVDRFLPKSRPSISSTLLEGLVDLAETDRLKTSLKVSFINDILKNLQFKTSDKASIFNAIKKLRLLAENLAIEQIEFLDMDAARNILANFVKEPLPSFKELADMIQSVGRFQAFTELPTNIEFKQFLSLLELAVRQAKQETPSEALITNLSRIMLSVGELMKNKPNLYGYIEGSEWLQWIEQCFLMTEAVIKKEIEKLGGPDQCSITLLKIMINTLRAGILLGSVASEKLFNIVKINSKKIIVDEDGLDYVSRLALYARVAKVELPTDMQDLLVSGKPELPSSDEMLQVRVHKALKDAGYKGVEMERGDLYPMDNFFMAVIREEEELHTINIELNGEQYHKETHYLRDSVVLWIGQADHVVNVNLKFQRTPTEIIQYALDMAEKDTELPTGVSWSQFLAREFRRPASALNKNLLSTAPVETKSPAPTTKKVVQTVKLELALPQASMQNPVMDEKNIAKLPAPIKTLKEFIEAAKAGDLEAVKDVLNKRILGKSAADKIDSNVQISILLQLMEKLRTNSTAAVAENLSKICEIFIERSSITSLTTHEVSTSSPKISPLVVALQFSQDDIVQLIKKKFTNSKKSISSTQNSSRIKSKKKKNLWPLGPSSPQTWGQVLDNAQKTVANLSVITQSSKCDSKAEAEVTPTGEEKKLRGIAHKTSAPLPDHTPSLDLAADEIASLNQKDLNEIASSLPSFNFRKFPKINTLHRFAAKGNTEANTAVQLLLGIMYYEGLGVTEDNNKAMQWLTPAAKLNHPVALYRLGLCKLDDDSLKNKYEQAFELFKLSASQNNAGAQYELARLYFTGSGVEKDLQKAIYWLQLAANQGLAEAECYLGDCFEEGLGVQMDLSKAREYFQRAADKGFLAAQSQLGVFCMQGIGGPKDVKVGIRLIKAAALMGDTFAQKNLGIYYDEGRGVEKDITKAIHYLELAAVQGEPTAEFEIARRSHLGGLGVPVDLNKAISLYTSSAAKGNQFAQFNLARCYYEGIGVKLDRLTSYNLFKSAAAQGNEKAKAVVQEMFRDYKLRGIIQTAESKESIRRSIITAMQTGSPLHTSAPAGNEQTTQSISPCISVFGGPTKLFGP